MNRLLDLVRSLDRTQQTLWFKIAASIAVAVLAAGLLLYFAVESPAADAPQRIEPTALNTENIPRGRDPAEQASIDRMVQIERDREVQYVRMVNDLVAAQTSIAERTSITLIVAGIALVIIWIGVALTYLAIALAGAIVVVPLLLLGNESMRTLGGVAGGVLALAAAFSGLIRALSLTLSYPHPITAIARNVVFEATRMKISLVFVVLLIFLLASLPFALDPTTPLRYRVQSFLSYSVGVSFALSALLVLFLAVGSVAFEQRDRVIWQTVTKPVAAWQYVIGKWLGATMVGLVLLSVCSSGVFLFMEHLRRQKAQGEVTPFVVDARDPRNISPDRMELEYRILAARRSERPSIPPELAEMVQREVDTRVQEQLAEREKRPDYPPPDLVRIRRDAERLVLLGWLSLAPGDGREYRFAGLNQARATGKPLTFRYKIQSGANNPTVTYRLTFQFEGGEPFVREVTLNQPLTLPLPASLIREDGTLPLLVWNGDFVRRINNAETLTFPPDGLELSFSEGGFRANFLRVMIVLWMKIAFLAMLGVTSATFLSFPVASLVSFATFFAAEGSAFLATALDYFQVTDNEQNVLWYRVAIYHAADVIANVLNIYGTVDPVNRIVEGLMLDWAETAGASSVMLLLCAGFGLAAVLIFRKRELAIYSGN